MTDKSHPLEDIFDIEPGTTPVFADLHPEMGTSLNEIDVNLVDPTTGELVPRSSTPNSAELDREDRIEDLRIDKQLEQIHNNAVIAFEKSSRMAEEVDPKFAARNAEVAAQYLNIALNAVNSRVDAKFKRQKVRLARDGGSHPTTVNNNVIVADRNELLRQLLGKSEPSGVTVEQTN